MDNDRKLLVDTISTAFKEPLSCYFSSSQSNVELLSSVLQIPSSGSVYPRLGSHRFEYTVEYKDGIGFIDCETKKPTSFNFTKSYEEDILIHHGCGGGILSFEAFSFLQFNTLMLSRIQVLFNSIPKPYCSLHLRGTDGLGTNFEPLIDHLESLPSQQFFVATDSRRLLEIVKTRLSKHRLISYSAASIEVDDPLHVFMENDPRTHDRARINGNTIIDLGLLALADKYYYVDPELYGGWVSGFSRLAKFLHSNKKYLLPV